MSALLGYAPVAAACFGVPQFVPQMLKLRATSDRAGVSWSWAALTTVNNAAWIAYFALSRDWTALIPSCSATLLAGTLTVMLSRTRRPFPRATALMAAWAAALAAVGYGTGRVGLGTLLTAAFAVQVAPSLWTAYRTARPSGISSATWALILGELACFLAYGLYQPDPRLIVLGATGVAASTLMLVRILWAALRARGATGSPAVPSADFPWVPRRPIVKGRGSVRKQEAGMSRIGRRVRAAVNPVSSLSGQAAIMLQLRRRRSYRAKRPVAGSQRTPACPPWRDQSRAKRRPSLT